MRKSVAFTAIFFVMCVFTPNTSFAVMTPEQDFLDRCTSSGVVRCFDFDDEATAQQYLEAADDGSLPVIDNTMLASGTGSLRFAVPKGSTDNLGGFNMNFKDDFSLQFGEGQEFYVQWRQRFSDNFLSTNFGTEGFKQAIVGEGDRRGYWAPGCSELEVVMENSYFRGFPQGFHSCNNWVSFQDQIGTIGNYDWKLQNAIPAPYCLYSDNPAYQVFGNPPCFLYEPNQWMTFQVHVKIGHWNKPDSTVEFWGANQGQESVPFISMKNFTLINTKRGKRAKYGKVILTPWMSGKDPRTPNRTAYTWYDELIVSTKRIRDPGM